MDQELKGADLNGSDTKNLTPLAQQDPEQLTSIASLLWMPHTRARLIW
jgi:hypothetical protein